MRTNNQNQSVKNVRHNSKASESGGRRPENKDNLDNRSGEEQDFKGGDVTHNKRETKEEKQKKGS